MDRPGTDLTVQQRPIWTRIGAILLVAGAVGLAVFYAGHPAALPTEERTVTASTPVDQAIYVGVARGVEGRALRLSAVRVQTTSDVEVDVVPLLCLGGAVDVTTAPESYCADVVDPEGKTFRAADSIMLRVTAQEEGRAAIDPVRLGFREGLQWSTFPTGAGASVDILAR